MPLPPVLAFRWNRASRMLAPQVRDIALIVLPAEHRVEPPEQAAHGCPHRMCRAASRPGSTLRWAGGGGGGGRGRGARPARRPKRPRGPPPPAGGAGGGGGPAGAAGRDRILGDRGGRGGPGAAGGVGGGGPGGPGRLDGLTCTTVGHLAERYRRRLGRDGARASVRCVDPPGCRAAERCHRRPGRCLGTQCVLACAAPGSFTSPFSISSSHSRCTSFSAAVGKNPLGAKMREGSSGDSVVSAVPARQAR